VLFFVFGEIKSNENTETELRETIEKLLEGKIKEQKIHDN